MMRSYPISLYWAPFLLALLFSFLPISTVSAQALVGTPLTGLPEGCHIATEADRSAGGASVIVGVTNICPSDVKAGINGDVGAAKDYLYSIAKNLRKSCAPVSDRKNIDRLNNGFAVCAAAFFKAYKAQYGEVTVVSAFRDGAPGTAIDGSGRSANQCAGGAPNSNHTRGYAIDASATAGYQTMWKFAEANPQFGVCFPYQDGKRSGYNDPPHMALAGIGGREGSLCAAQGVTKPCVAGASFVPTTPTPGTGGTTAPQTPLPPRRDVDGTLTCQHGYILFEGQCFPAPDEAIPQAWSGAPTCALDAQMCPDGSYVGRTGPNCSFAPCSTGSGQSYCQVGYVFVNGQCAPMYCNGSSPYAVVSTNPIQVIQCTQQQYNQQCPMGYLMISNQCVPFSQNQNMSPMGGMQSGGMQGGMSPGGTAPIGSQTTGGTVPGGSAQTGGTGTSGQGSTVIGGSQCTPRTMCQNSVVYQQTNLCMIQMLQTCQYGCASDGINCATGTSASSTGTTTGTTNTPLSTVPSRILEQIERLTGASAQTPAPIINSTVLTEADISAIRAQQGLGSVTPLGDMLPSTFNASRMIYANGIPDIFIPLNTFDQNYPIGINGIANDSYSPTSQMSLLQSAFRNIRWTIEGILTYLRILQQPTPATPEELYF